MVFIAICSHRVRFREAYDRCMHPRRSRAKEQSNSGFPTNGIKTLG